jgi:hypothetical protein
MIESPKNQILPTPFMSFSGQLVRAVGRDVVVTDLRIEMCERFVFHLWCRKSVDCLRHVTDSHQAVERVGISAVRRGGRCFGCRAAVGV